MSSLPGSRATRLFSSAPMTALTPYAHGTNRPNLRYPLMAVNSFLLSVFLLKFFWPRGSGRNRGPDFPPSPAARAAFVGSGVNTLGAAQHGVLLIERPHV